MHVGRRPHAQDHARRVLEAHVGARGERRDLGAGRRAARRAQLVPQRPLAAAARVGEPERRAERLKLAAEALQDGERERLIAREPLAQPRRARRRRDCVLLSPAILARRDPHSIRGQSGQPDPEAAVQGRHTMSSLLQNLPESWRFL